MFDITLICTTHKETGKCSADGLVGIIKQYNPDVIFEEISHAVFHQCYVLQNRSTLETNAINKYLTNKSVLHFPVVSFEYADDVIRKFEIVTKNSDYRHLFDRLLEWEGKYGFGFLNSSQCEKIFEDLNSIEELILKQSNDEQLKSLFELSDRIIDQYENDIIKNIYEYSTDNNFEKALLFIGAAHRKSIRRKLGEYDQHSDVQLNWSFYNET